MYRYYVGYLDPESGQVGGIDTTQAKPIRNMSDVTDLQTELRKHRGSQSLVVTAFSRFED